MRNKGDIESRLRKQSKTFLFPFPPNPISPDTEQAKEEEIDRIGNLSAMYTSGISAHADTRTIQQNVMKKGGRLEGARK